MPVSEVTVQWDVTRPGPVGQAARGPGGLCAPAEVAGAPARPSSSLGSPIVMRPYIHMVVCEAPKGSSRPSDPGLPSGRKQYVEKLQ